MCDFEAATIDYSDGYQGYARYWQPVGQVRGTVVYLHGIQSHGGWFETSAAATAEAGYHVLLPDRRGSGRNKQDRGHARSAERLVADVVEAVRWAQAMAGTPKVTLVGVSWGGKLALAAAMHYPELVDKAVLVAPGLCPQVDLPGREKLSIAFNALFRPKRLFPIPLNEPELFTDNPARQAFIRDDPLRLRQATARFFAASRMLDIRIRRQAGRREWPFSLAVLLAGRERIIDNEATRRLVRGVRCRRRWIIEHTNAAHTLEFEADVSEYLGDLVTAVAGPP